MKISSYFNYNYHSKMPLTIKLYLKSKLLEDQNKRTSSKPQVLQANAHGPQAERSSQAGGSVSTHPSLTPTPFPHISQYFASAASADL